MTEELKTLAGQAPVLLKNLRWRHYIEFAQTFGVGVENLEELPPDKKYEAIAWLYWTAQGRPCGFEEFLDQPLPEELFHLAP